jgi:hypothetical protein
VQHRIGGPIEFQHERERFSGGVELGAGDSQRGWSD